MNWYIILIPLQEDTNYYFSVSPLDHEDSDDDTADVDPDADPIAAPGGRTSAALSGALDRLAQFMISPTFNASMVERELRAIDSEYLNSVSSDSWRNFQLLKSYANPNHPFGKFGCGNYKTLTNGGDIGGEAAELSGGSNPRDDLVKFWEDNYQTPKMRLCVVGRAGLDELQSTVERTFGMIKPPSREWLEANPPVKLDETKMFPSEHARYETSVFDADEFLGVLREVVPVVETRMIKLQFATPPFDDAKLADVRPYRVISHLLGHESVGSLHSLLNEEGYINSLSSGVGIDTTDFSLCSVTISLTPKGLQERDRVLALVWQWINLIKSSVKNDSDGALMAKYHQEMSDMAAVNFRYRENGDPCDFCTTAAGMLFTYEPANCHGSGCGCGAAPRTRSEARRRGVLRLGRNIGHRGSSKELKISHVQPAGTASCLLDRWWEGRRGQGSDCRESQGQPDFLLRQASGCPIS